MIVIKKIINLMLSSFLAVLALTSVVYYINISGDKTDESPKPKQVVKTNKQSVDMQKVEQTIACLQSSENMEKCFEATESKKVADVVKKTIRKEGLLYKIYKALKQSQDLIVFCYITITIFLAYTLYLLFDTLHIGSIKHGEYNRIVVNASPAIGTIGTLISLAFFTQSSSGTNDMITLFKDNIYSSVGTTVFGLFVYVVALYTQATYDISKRVSYER